MNMSREEHPRVGIAFISWSSYVTHNTDHAHAQWRIHHTQINQSVMIRPLWWVSLSETLYSSSAMLKPAPCRHWCWYMTRQCPNSDMYLVGFNFWSKLSSLEWHLGFSGMHWKEEQVTLSFWHAAHSTRQEMDLAQLQLSCQEERLEALVPHHLFMTVATPIYLPCALCCTTTKSTSFMLPGRYTCPLGWSSEYTGYIHEWHNMHTKAGKVNGTPSVWTRMLIPPAPKTHCTSKVAWNTLALAQDSTVLP